MFTYLVGFQTGELRTTASGCFNYQRLFYNSLNRNIVWICFCNGNILTFILHSYLNFETMNENVNAHYYAIILKIMNDPVNQNLLN